MVTVTSDQLYFDSSKAASLVPSPLTGEGTDGDETSYITKQLLKITILPVEPGVCTAPHDIESTNNYRNRRPCTSP